MGQRVMAQLNVSLMVAVELQPEGTVYCLLFPEDQVYDPSLSTSQKPFTGSKNLTIGTISINGSFIKEDCGLHEVNGSSWLYKNQTGEFMRQGPSDANF